MFHKTLRYILLGYRLKMSRPTSRSWHSGLGWSALGSIGVSLALAMPPAAIAPAYAAELTEWRFDPTTRQLELNIPGGTTPNYFLLAQPARIVLDLPNTIVSNPLEEQTYSGVVRSIRVSQFQPTLTRIVIELSPDAELAPAQVELRQVAPPGISAREQWIVRPLLAGDAPVAAIEPVPPTPAPDGLDTVPEETGGVTVEANPGMTNDADGDINADDPAGPQSVDLFDLVTRNDEPETATADAAGVDEPDDRLPPLEPGAFEIPIEIPPPLPDIDDPPAQNMASDTTDDAPDSEADVEMFPDDIISDDVISDDIANAPDDDESASLPVAIAPPPPSFNAEETHTEESRDEEVAENSNASVAASAPQGEEASTRRRDVINTPDDLERALADALPEGTSITVVGSGEESLPDQPTESEMAHSADAQSTENDLPSATDDADTVSPVLPDLDLDTESDTESQPDAPHFDPSPTDDVSPTSFQPDDADVADTADITEVPAHDSPFQLDTNEFPSPNDAEAESFAVTPIESEFLSALPPAQSTVDLPVTVTVPSPGKADEDEADPLTSETRPTAPLPEEPDEPPTVSQWDIQPDNTRPNPESEQEHVAQVPTAPTIPPSQLSVALSNTTPTVARAANSPVNVIEFGQPIDGQPSNSPSPEQAARGQSSTAPQTTSFPSPSSLQQRPAIATPAIAATSGRQLVVAARPGAMIPSGTVLRLRYPRLTPTLLQKGIAWQDVLLLEQTLLDAAGNVIAIEGTPVIGRFEITPQYVRFVTQAIALDDRNIPLQAISGWVPVSAESTAVVIRPNQIVNVRLSDNFDR